MGCGASTSRRVPKETGVVRQITNTSLRDSNHSPGHERHMVKTYAKDGDSDAHEKSLKQEQGPSSPALGALAQIQVGAEGTMQAVQKVFTEDLQEGAEGAMKTVRKVATGAEGQVRSIPGTIAKTLSGLVPSRSSAKGLVSANVLPELRVRRRGTDFVDRHGRVLTLRGVNLAGTCKMPRSCGGAEAAERGGTHTAEGFYETEDISFVGRPFPLEEADVHLTRLRAYGCSVVRLLVTWEAVEHAGPGKYDEEYLRYLTALAAKCAEYAINIYVDPHQDVWSRYSGGDGAPAWTFAAAGLDVRALDETAAALRHQTHADPEKFPLMCWPTNMFKLGCGTMFSLFWGGATLAPNTKVDGESIQPYLQRHFANAMAQIARALRGCPNVIGFGTLNEPLPGYIGYKDLGELKAVLKNGYMPTPFEAMQLGSGYSLEVPVYACDLISAARGVPKRRGLLNPDKRSAWLEGRSCVWRDNGVWDVDPATDRPRLLRPDHFAAADFGALYVDFARMYIDAVRAAGHPDWACFVELPPADLGLCEFPHIEPDALPGCVHAPHWYDQLTLYLGRFIPWCAFDVQTGEPALGRDGVRRQHTRQVLELAALSTSHMGGVPTFIGEFGIPFSLNGREAYVKGTLDGCTAALDSSVSVLEAAGVSYALWCYAPEHCAKWGDLWNREDLSIYSTETAREVDEKDDPAGVYVGGRSLRGFVRPYALALNGETLKPPVFDLESGCYTLDFKHVEKGAPAKKSPTVIFVPRAVQYPKGYDVAVSDGEFSIERMPARHGGYDLIRYAHSTKLAKHFVQIRPRVKPKPRSLSLLGTLNAVIDTSIDIEHAVAKAIAETAGGIARAASGTRLSQASGASGSSNLLQRKLTKRLSHEDIATIAVDGLVKTGHFDVHDEEAMQVHECALAPKDAKEMMREESLGSSIKTPPAAVATDDASAPEGQASNRMSGGDEIARTGDSQ